MNYTIADLLSRSIRDASSCRSFWFCFGVFCHYQRYFVLSLEKV